MSGAWPSDDVAEQPVTQLRLEPGGLRRHDVAGIGYRHEVLDAHGIQREGDGRLACVDATLELRDTAKSADEIDPGIGSYIRDAEKRGDDALLEEGDVQIAWRSCRSAERKLVPASVEVHRDPTAPIGTGETVDRGYRQTQRREELGRRPARQVADDPVVGEDAYLIVWERHRDERIVLGDADIIG